MSTYLYSSICLMEYPEADLNPGSGDPFVTIELDGDRRNYLALRSLEEARVLADVTANAVLLFERLAAGDTVDDLRAEIKARQAAARQKRNGDQ